jgi:hypothetical protein
VSAKAELPQRLRAGKPPIRAYGQRDASASAMAAYAYDQIDQARAELKAVSK